MSRISVLIPAYMERENLPRLVKGVNAALQGDDFEVIIVNDCYLDGSVKVIKDLETKYTDVKGVFFDERQGKTNAIREAFKKSKGSILILLDADLQFSPRDIPRLIEGLECADVVNGLRVDRKDSLARRIESKIYNLLIRLFFHTRFYDCNSGLKVFKRRVMRDIADQLRDGWHRYLLVLATEKGYEVAEIPINHYPREFGQSKFIFSPVKLFKGLRDLLSVKAFIFKHRDDFTTFGSDR